MRTLPRAFGQRIHLEEFLAIIDQADEEKKSVDERLADMGEAEADQY